MRARTHADSPPRRLAPARLRYQHATKSEIKLWPPGVPLRVLDPSAGQNAVGGCQQSCTPTSLAGSGAREPLTAGPGLRGRRASRAGPPRALPGEKEKPWTVGARSLAAASAENGRRRGWAGAGAELRGPGEAGASQPNSRTRLRGGTRNADWSAAGGGRVPGGVGGGGARSPSINYCLGARVPARAASRARHPPSRPPALGRSKSRGGGRRGKPVRGCLGVRGSEVLGGRRGRGGACRVGEGTGNCRRGWEGRGRPAAGGNRKGATEAGGDGWPGLGGGGGP